MQKGIGKGAEETCAQIFEQYLKEHFAVHSIVWEEGDEPPDRYMLVQDRRYAVEVTTLVASLPLACNSKRPLPGIHAIHDRLVEETERIALERGILDGAYSVCFIRSIVGRRELEREASDFILDFVKETSGDDTSELRRFDSSSSYLPLGYIVKHHRKYPRLCGGQPPIVASEAALCREARRILEDRVKTKIGKLARLGLPKVLLLLDATLLMEPKYFLANPMRSNWEESVDAAFLIRGDGEVTELWSRIVRW